MDWDSKVTKKHIKEAKAVGLTLIEKGRNRNHRLYKFNSCNHQQEIMLHAVRIKNFRCNTCDQEKYEAEAKVVGLTLVGASGKKGYRTYKCNKCGNDQEITISHVRKNSFRCLSCVTTNLEKEAKVVGLSILSEGKSKAYKTYLFNDCGHKQEIRFTDVRNKSFRCNICLKLKIEEEAKKAGLKLLGKGRDRSTRTYSFIDCGHKQVIVTSSVRTNNFRCNSCLQLKLQKEAKAVGLTLIGKGSNKDYRAYQFDKCGHKQELQTGNVRINIFLCNTCEETSRDLPSKVYLLSIQVGSEE